MVLNFKKGQKVELNLVEQYLCKLIAKARYQINRDKGIKNKKIGDQDNEFTDLNGIGGEVAFCKLVDCFPDTNIKVTSSQQGNDQGDCRLPNGSPIDVKTTKHLNGHLLIAPWKTSKNIQFYVLMVGEFPSYTYKGCLSTKEFLTDKYFQNFGKQKTYVATQNQLKDFKNYESTKDT